jgi:large subunit ribosomal protein L29
MKKTKPSELRDKNLEELSKLASEKSENLFNLKVRRAAGTLESSADIRSVRRDLARVKTVLHQKQKAARAAQSP